MNLTDLALRHRLTVSVLAVLIAVMGVSSYTSLPRESFPEIEIPLILVYTSYSGVSPEDIETLITRPIETELKGISGLKEVRSTSSEGLSMIEVEFNPELDLDTALQKVREKVDLAKAEMPPEVDDPRVQDIDFSQIPILIATLSGDVGLVQLKELAEDLKDDLEALPGVNRVQLIGGREREVHVFVDPRRLSAYQLGLTDVVRAVARENLTVPGGDIDVGGLNFLVRIPGEVQDPAEIEQFVVEVRDGVPVQVRDLGHVVYGFEDESTRSRLDGNPAVTLTVEKRTGSNIIAVADAVKQELERLRTRLPPSVHVTLVADQSKDIRSMVSELENNIISGLILVVAVLMVFMGLRNSLFVAVAIPLSMLISFSAVQAMGYTLNMVVLFSFILVLGMLVDNAIVIVENIYRHREQGETGPEAASRGTSEVAIPVFTSTLTTCCAFAPMLVWPGIIGDFMSYLPVTLIIGLSASLLVALIFNPPLCASLMAAPLAGTGRGSEREGRFLSAYRRLLVWLLAPAPDADTRGWFLRNWLLITLFGLGLSAGMTLALAAFSLGEHGSALMGPASVLMAVGALAFALQGLLWLGWTVLRRATGWGPWITDRRAGVLWNMGAILTGTVIAYGALGQGTEFFPEMEPRQIWVDVEVPSGSSLEASDALIRRIEERTVATADLRHAIANVGSLGVSADGPAVGGSVSTQSRVTLDLADKKDRGQNSKLTLEQVRERLGTLAGAEIKVDRMQDGPPTGKPVTIRVIGDDLGPVGAMARDIRAHVRTIPGLVNLTDDYDEGKPEVRVHVDRVRAAVAGVNTADIAATVQTAIRGSEASKYRIGEDEYDIRVRLAPDFRQSLADLGQLTVPDEDGLPVPLRDVARFETGVGPAAIRRVDLKRVVTIEGDVVRAPGRTDDTVRAEIAARLGEMTWPPGMRWEYAGSNQEQDESQGFLQRAFVVAVLLIALVLITQFDSLTLPITVMVSVVLSLIGVLWGLILTGTPFGIIMTGIGVISLAGIAVNNAIVLCDFVVQLRRQGFDRTQAAVEAGVIRLRPVLLTAITTILGLIPLTVGLNVDFFAGTVEYGAESSQWWGPMGVAVIAGLFVATVLTLVVVPVTFHSLDSFAELATDLPRRWRARAAQDAARAPETAEIS